MKIFVSVLLTLFTASLSAQSVSGNWYGVGIVDKDGEHNSYLSELIIKQNGAKVTGEFSYFFRDFTAKTRITGTYDSRSRVMHINAHPLLNFRATNANGADCPMEGWFTLRVSRVQTSLSGEFIPLKKYRLTCPAIKVKFIKSIPQEPVTTVKPLEIKTDTPVVVAPTPEVKKPVEVVDRPLSDLNKRVFEASPVIEVDADSLKVDFYDNGTVDGDTITIFYNRKLIGAKKLLSDRPLSFTLPIDSAINEIAMYADNMGSIPPNTALAIIYAGDQRFELNMTSTFIKNSTLRFRKRRQTKDPKSIN